MWKFIKKQSAVLRAIVVVGVVGTLVSSVTYATLQSQSATLTGNTIQSATADLRIGTTASTFAASHAGFTFQDVVPGGPAIPTAGNTFYLKNYGTAALSVRLAIGTTPTNTTNVDLSKVTVQITRVDTGTTQTASLQQLVQAYTTNGFALTDTLNPGAIAQYTARISMTADAFTGSSATIGAIDLVFSGTAAL